LTTLIKKSIINPWFFTYLVQIFIYILQKERKKNLEIIIHGRHLDATEAIKNYINKKASKLTKYSTKISKIQFTLKIEGQNNNIVEAICSAARATLVAEVTDADMYAAIDLVVDKLEKQIIKQKEKLKQPRRSNKGETTVESEDEEEEE